ncbi:MAG: SGNH/GDSL hydrolase family protein [Actinobacteria bacterium]|nr:SGNH/GDSL hydrolase family protein [Actinomycetota bacterium]
MRIDVYAALGDSFTAGRESVIGERWADRLATGLRQVNPDLVYENLAVDGADSAEVLEQVPAATTLRPDLVTVICGANDVLLTVRPDVEGYEQRFARILEALREELPEAAIVTGTAPETWHFMDLRPRTRKRLAEATEALNEATRRIAAEHDKVLCLPVAGHPALEDPANYAADGLHASPRGHELIARETRRYLHEAFGIEIGATAA